MTVNSAKRPALVLALLAALATAGCGANPRHEIARVDTGATIRFVGGAEGSQVFIDGNPVLLAPGPRRSFQATAAGGTREIRVVRNGTEIYNRKLFIQDGTTFRIDLGK